MDISVEYYTTSWQDLTPYVTAFRVEDEGINRAPQATVNLEGTRTAFNAYLANPYRTMRVRIKPTDSWQQVFLGYVDNPHLKSITGTITERSKLSLDLFGSAQRLATDHITFDYYKLQSAINPYVGAEAWTYRKVIADFLAYPDSTRDGTGLDGTPFTLNAANNPDGIDHAIDASGNFDRQTLLEAIRTICDHIGYDGYVEGMEIYLYPFNKSPTATLSDPFIREPEWVGGSLADIANVIFIWGGTDRGIPSDRDKFTEYGVEKYDPAAWGTLYVGGTPWTSDENNTVFNTELRVNNKCILSTGTGFTSEECEDLYTTLDLVKAGYSSIDAKNRVTSFVVNMKFYQSNSTYGRRIISFILTDSGTNKIIYQTEFGVDSPPNYPAGFEKQYDVPIGTDQEIVTVPEPIFINIPIRKWSYLSGSTFDWEHIIAWTIKSHWRSTTYPPSDTVWGHYLDGLMFIGGYKIEPFLEYSELLNPPAVSQASIDTYKTVNVLHYQDSIIQSFEQAQAEGARLLNNLQNPIGVLTCAKSAPVTQLRPSNVVTVATVDYRIVGVTYEWNATTKDCTAEYKMVQKTATLPPIWTLINEMRYLVK